MWRARLHTHLFCWYLCVCMYIYTYTHHTDHLPIIDTICLSCTIHPMGFELVCSRVIPLMHAVYWLCSLISRLLVLVGEGASKQYLECTQRLVTALSHPPGPPFSPKRIKVRGRDGGVDFILVMTKALGFRLYASLTVEQRRLEWFFNGGSSSTTKSAGFKRSDKHPELGICKQSTLNSVQWHE